MAMTPEEFGAKMQKIHDDYQYDVEEVHSKMDDAMCDLLIELGYAKAVAIFDAENKWYA